MDPTDEMAVSSLRMCVYKRLGGSLSLYLIFLTLAHVFWTTLGAFLEPGGITISLFGCSASLVTIVELSFVALVLMQRWAGSFCSGISAFIAPIIFAVIVFFCRVQFSRGGSLFDSNAYGGPTDWSNAKASHIATAYSKAFYSHTLRTGFTDWLFLMGAALLAFYAKYCILSTHRSAQHALAKIARLTQAATCCLFGDHIGTFSFFAFHILAGGIIAAVLCSRMGINSRFVDPASGQIVDVYDRMTVYVQPTPGSTLRYTVDTSDGSSQVTSFLLKHWYWTLFGFFNGAVAAVLHIVGNRNVLAPIAHNPSTGSPQSVLVATSSTLCRNLASNGSRALAATGLSVILFVLLTGAIHWTKRMIGDTDTDTWEEIGDLQLPLFDANADGVFDSLSTISARLLRATLTFLRIAWGIHFIFDVAQLALDVCVAFPINLASEVSAANGEDLGFGLRAAVSVLDHTASSEFEYLLKCYHGGIDGLTAEDHDEARRRFGYDSNTLVGNQTGIVAKPRRRFNRRRTGDSLMAITPSLGTDVYDSDSDTESVGSDPDEDGAAQTPWRRELRQGAVRFHSVALRSIYQNHNDMSQHPSYCLEVPSSVLAKFDDARCYRSPKSPLWLSTFHNWTPTVSSLTCRGDDNGSSLFAGIVGQLVRSQALEGLKMQLKFHASAHEEIHDDVLLHTRRHDSFARYHRSLWARIVATCTAHIDAFTLNALFASDSVKMSKSSLGNSDLRPGRLNEDGGVVAGVDVDGRPRTRGLKWNHVYMIDSDELGEAVAGCCPRGCGKFLGLRPLADLRRALSPYNSVAAYLLNYRAPQYFGLGATGVTASIFADYQALVASCEILVDLLLRGFEWEQELETQVSIARANGQSGRGSGGTDAHNAAEIVEHTVSRVLSCLLGALGALRTFAKSPVALGSRDQAAALRQNFEGASPVASSSNCDAIVQRVRGQVFAFSMVLKTSIHRLVRTHPGLQVSRRDLPVSQAVLLQQVLQGSI